MTSTEALKALNNKQFIGFTTTTGNIIMSKLNKTEYNIYVYEEGIEEPAHYIGNVANVLRTMNDKSSNKDFMIVEK